MNAADLLSRKSLIYASFFVFLFLMINGRPSAGKSQFDAELSPAPAENATAPTQPPEPTPVTGLDPSPTPEPTLTPGPTPTLAPDYWKMAPILPTALSDNVIAIYRLGQTMGNDPKAFSKVGDCNSTNPYFLTEFDLEPEAYQLGEYQDLQATIEYFSGSFGRTSLAAKNGLTATAVLAPLWTDWKVCHANETPLECEYRLHKPSFAILSFGTNDAMGVVPFEDSMRRVIEHTIGNGIVPILSTKADNAEGGHKINQTIVKLAYEYQLPLWNYWLAVQPLPEHGLRSRDHLSDNNFADYFDFETPGNLKYGWPVRNLTALQVLDAVREMILEQTQ